MNITCPSCASRYAVDDSRVPDNGVTIRCPSCQHKFVVKPDRDAPVSLPPSAPPRPPSGAVPLPGASSQKTAPEQADSVPLPGSSSAPPAAAPPPTSAPGGPPGAEPGLDELSFPSVSGPAADAGAAPIDDSLDLGLDDDPRSAPPQRPRPRTFEPPDDLPGLPGQAPPRSPAELPDLPGLPEARSPSSQGAGEHPDLPGLPEAPSDLPGLPSSDPRDLPGLPQAPRAASEDILGFIDDEAARVETGAGPGGHEFRIRRRNGKLEGPFGSERILAMIRAGQLSGGEDVSTDGVSWRALTSIPQFNEALNRAADASSYGEVDFGGGGPGADGVAPVGLDLPGHANLPDRAGGAGGAGLTGDFADLSLDTGPLDEGAEAAALGEVDAMMDELGGARAEARLDGDVDPFTQTPAANPLGGLGGPSGGDEAGSQDAAREVLEVGEIPELPPIWKTYRKPIIAFSALAGVILVGVYTQLFTPYGAFGIQGAVEWALEEPPPPPPPVPKPPPPKKVDPADLASLLQEGGYESLRSVMANARSDGSTPATRTLLAKAAVYGGLRFPEAEDFGLELAKGAVADLEGLESLDATLARAGLQLLAGDPDAALKTLPAEGGEAAEVHWLRGLAHMKGNRPAQAAEAFDGALVADADFAPAATGLGRVALARGDVAAAAPWLLRAHRLAPKLGPTGLMASETLEAAERGGEAARVRLRVARNVDGLAPAQRAPLLAQVAAEHDAQGRIAEVADLALEAARLAPADPAIGALAAAAEIATGEAAAALSRMEGHLQRAPKDVTALVGRARAHMALQDVAKAFLDLETARAQAPRSVEVALWEARFNAQLGKLSDAREAYRIALQRSGEDVTARVSLGRLELVQGDVERAFELAREAVQLEPGNPSVRLLLADCLAERGQLDKALESYARAASEDPTSLTARLGQANMLRARAERTPRPAESEALGAAFAHYVQAWAQAPENPKVLFELGRALELEGQLGNALSLYQEAASLDEEDVRPHLRMAAAFMEQASPDLAAAKASLKTAQAIERQRAMNDPAVRFWEARVALAEGRSNDAVSSMREAVEAEPKNSLYHYWLGQSLERDNSLYEAVAAYEEAVRLNSRFAAAQRALGWTALEQHRFKTARRWFNEYRKNEPTDGSIYVDIGSSFIQQNKDGPALRAFRRALDYRPDDVEALLQVGNILSRRGQEPRARQMYEKAVKIEPDHPEAVCLLAISQATRRVLPETKKYLERCRSMEGAPQDLKETAEDILLTPR